MTLAHSLRLRYASIIVTAILLFVPAAHPETTRAIIRVDLNAPGPVISNHIFGNNMKVWGGGGEMVWDTNGHTLKNGIVERLAPLGVTVLRFPGGSKAEEYDWRAAVGKTRGGTGGTRFDFGTDEFMEFCRRLKAEPLITVNGGAAPKEAADWVEYCNGSIDTPMGKLRAENGHPLPYNVRCWEIGNENYVSQKAKDYAASIPEFARLMKAADPSIKIGGVGWGWPNWKSHYTKDTDPWNETVLAIAGKHLDAFIIHEYCWIDPAPKPEQRTDELMHTVLGWPPQMAKELLAVRKSFADAGVPDLPIWMTEFNGYYGEKGMCKILGHTINGVLVASMMNEFVRLNIPLACNWDMASSGWSRFAAIANPSEGKWMYRPSWHVLSLYARSLSGRILPVSVDGPRFDHAKYSIVRAGKDTPGIDVIAAQNSNAVTLMLVNKLEYEVTAVIQLDGASKAAGISCTLFSGENAFSETYGIRETIHTPSLPASVVLPACSVSAVTIKDIK
ncbi:MAG: hypothetical protein HZC28_11685 [Spirochaetes bacterium]|nr:hypothetical protein [Spirochaetota bacterium]